MEEEKLDSVDNTEKDEKELEDTEVECSLTVSIKEGNGATPEVVLRGKWTGAKIRMVERFIRRAYNRYKREILRRETHGSERSRN
jgi:hypothetical protein